MPEGGNESLPPCDLGGPLHATDNPQAYAVPAQQQGKPMPWHYKLHVVETSSGWALEVEDPTNERELVRRFDTAGEAAKHAETL